MMNKLQLVHLFEEKILKGQKDKYVKSMEDLFETSTIELGPNKYSVQELALAFDELFEKLTRFQPEIALAESDQTTWKQLWPLILKLWEQGHLKKANTAWNNGAAVSTVGTIKLRAALP